MRKLLEKCQLNSLSDSDNTEHTDGKRSLYVPENEIERVFSVKGKICCLRMLKVFKKRKRKKIIFRPLDGVFFILKRIALGSGSRSR